jgi:hypothetical protein
VKVSHRQSQSSKAKISPYFKSPDTRIRQHNKHEKPRRQTSKEHTNFPADLKEMEIHDLHDK